MVLSVNFAGIEHQSQHIYWLSQTHFDEVASLIASSNTRPNWHIFTKKIVVCMPLWFRKQTGSSRVGAGICRIAIGGLTGQAERNGQMCQNSPVWRHARPKRSGNAGVRHVPTKQNNSGESRCQNLSLKFWPPGTELWSARVQNK